MGSSSGRRSWLTRNLTLLSLVSLFQDTASELLYPILPIFLTVTLGAPVAVVGIIEGLADGAASITKVLSGRLADRKRRRPLVAAGYGVAAIAKLIIAAATVWPTVLVARVVDRIGKGIRGAPRDAMIADGTPAKFRGRAFGFHRSIDTWGAVLGPLIGLALYQALDQNLRPLLWIAAIPAIVSVGFVFLVRELPSPVPTTAEPTTRSGDGLPRRFWNVAAALTVFALVNFPDALLILRAKSLGLGVSAVIGVYCLYNLSYALLSYPAGVVSDGRSRRAVVASGLGVFAAVYFGLGVVTTSSWVWILFPCYGAYTALTEGVTKAWVVDLAPTNVRGRALGWQSGLSGGGVVIAGLWAGLAWGDDGRVPLMLAGIVAGGIALALALIPLDRPTNLPRADEHP